MGVFVMGSNGEFYGFDIENQKKAVEVTVDHINGSIPVYAGANAITTKECVRLARMAEEAGADALTVLTPMFINPSENEMYEHFKTIARSTGLPVLLYNNPGKTTNNISVGLLKKIAQIDNIVGIKNTNLDFSQTIKILYEFRNDTGFKILAGTDYYILSTLLHGGVGCVAGTANVAPGMVCDIYNKFEEGDIAGAVEAQNRLIPLRDTYNYGSFPVVMKDCLNLMGLNIGHPVKPIDHCSEERMEELRKVLGTLNLL